MCKLEYTAEDFVLDPEFRKWVLSPDGTDRVYWEDYLKKNPSKYQEIVLARKILLNLARKSHEVSQARIADTWGNIEQAVDKMHQDSLDRKVVPLNALSTLKKHRLDHKPHSNYHQLYRMAGIITMAFALALLANFIQPREQVQIVEAPLLHEEHYAPPGVKSYLTLQDGSKVVLNSGSSLRYIKNFEMDQRVLELVGEAYFEVAKDSLRPFLVKTGAITTKALGTSFSIKAYQDEELNISLLTGLVEVDVDLSTHNTINLIPGEALHIDLEKQQFQKQEFEEEKSLAWIRKTIVFDHAPVTELTRTLENWYGVQIKFKNTPRRDLIVSGVFRDQTLENVLEGLSYSARFNFEINQDEVTLTFE